MPDGELLGLPLHAAARLIERREVSPVELTEQSLAAIDAANPILNAFRVMFPERALTAARRAEAEIAAGSYHGPLHGIPIGVKDLLDIAGETTPAGSKVLAERVDRGDLTEEHARRIGKQVLRDNALVLFPQLKDRLWKGKGRLTPDAKS